MKLVRDKIPEIVKAEGREIKTYVEDDKNKVILLLKQKLVEEANEVLASTDQNLVEELADVLEVFAELCKKVGAQDSVFIEREKKFEEKGGFSKNIVLTK